MPNILICDDDRDIVSALRIYLSDPEYKIFEAFNGRDAIEIIEKEDIHLLLLDIMMPLMDGITATAKIREISSVPIILLTAKSEDTDKVLGLNVGADDYITKPFNPLEVTARVRSQLRRYLRLGGGTVRPDNFAAGPIELDDGKKEVKLDGEPVSLTPKEYDILRLLISNPGRVFSPEEIYLEVWKEKPYGSESAVPVHIRHLREKLELNPAEPKYIKMVFGRGYKVQKEREI